MVLQPTTIKTEGSPNIQQEDYTYEDKIFTSPIRNGSKRNGISAYRKFSDVCIWDNSQVRSQRERQAPRTRGCYTVCSSDTHSMFRQQPKECKRRKLTAMMRHQMWLKSNAPHNNNQRPPSLQTKEKKDPPQPANQSVY